jgi:DNA recombination protein RmuC
MDITAALAGLVVGALAATLLARSRHTADVVRAELAEVALDAERRVCAERALALDEARDRLGDSFAAVSADVLQRNSEQFLALARTELARTSTEACVDLDQRRLAVEHLVAPLRDALAGVENHLQGTESARRDSYTLLTEQVRALGETHDKLRDQTRGLADALRAPNVRGRWGEMQLRRVVELAGMLPHCDFVEQPTVTTPDGVLRPDLVVLLPGGRSVVVDSKVPLAAYLEAAECTDDEARTAKLRKHARRLKAHVDALGAKAYWQCFQPSPDYVVLFMPGEAFLADALDQDPTLLEYAVGKGVVLASPTSLIALLKAVSLGWREESLAVNARQVCELGKELYSRLATVSGHVAGVGRQLDRAVESYNHAVGSLEGRVLVTARKLRDLDVTSDELPAPFQVERVSRQLQSPELLGAEVLLARDPPPSDPDEEPVRALSAVRARHAAAPIDVRDERFGVDRMPTREEVELASPA